ncbi:MAG TPA: FGGY family carbohydrate kinase [Acidimicrobiia bacterium]|nr:FGGY family carbohydrate kinase [Acidimicrobiia bacterium]
MVSLVMGVDSSTQSTKVEVRDADDGALVATGRAPHPAVNPPVSEQDPEAWWDALGAARAAAGHADDIVAISIAAQQHGLVVLDEAGRVIRPAKLWNDTESAPDASWLLDQLSEGASAWAAACGSVPVAAFTITKLSWLHRKEPDAFARIARVGLPHDWLAWRLSGEWATDRGDASGTGYWSPSEGRWRPELLEIIDADTDWAAALPRVAGPDEATGTGDNMAAALGAALAPGDVGVSLGTSGTVLALSERPTADASGIVAGFADATGRFLPLVCTLNATKVTDAIARLLGVDLATLDALALSAPASANRSAASALTLVPYLDGERTPNRPDARGTLSGIGSDVTREDLARAGFDGVVCGLLDGMDALGAAGIDTESGRLLLCGGGARSPAYRQALADLAQRAVTVVDDAEELVARGAAIQAAARHHGCAINAVQAGWSSRSETTVEPAQSQDFADARRAAYAAARG